MRKILLVFFILSNVIVFAQRPLIIKIKTPSNSSTKSIFFSTNSLTDGYYTLNEIETDKEVMKGSLYGWGFRVSIEGLPENKEYYIKMNPEPGFKLYFNNDHIKELVQWGDVVWVKDLSGMLKQLRSDLKITATDIPNFTNVENMSEFFYDCRTNINIPNIEKWDVSNVKDMSSMFRNSGMNPKIDSWNVSNVTDMFEMFSNSQFNQPIGGWNVSNVTNMTNMFLNSQFNQPIGGWNVSNVTNMNSMFTNSQFNQPIGKWNVSNVINMRNMFAGSQFNQPIADWNVSNVEIFDSMFLNAKSFDQYLGKWKFKIFPKYVKVNAEHKWLTSYPSFIRMFEGAVVSCKNNSLNIKGWDENNLTVAENKWNDIGAIYMKYDFIVEHHNGSLASKGLGFSNFIGPSNCGIDLSDTTPPNVYTKNINVDLSDSGFGFINVNDIDNGSRDDITSTDQLIFGLPKSSFTCSDIGDNTITLTVTDKAGNTATGTAIVTVRDVTRPTFGTLSPTLDLAGGSSVKITQEQVVTNLTDNCDSAPVVTISQTDFTSVGTHTVKVTVKDKYGNTSEKNTTVTVKDSYANISDLFNITVQDETCANKGNGSINIKASKDLAYSYSLNGGADTAFKNSVTIGNLKNGTYKICIKLPSGTQYCYELKVGAPANLTGKMSVSADGKVATINILEGTAPFIVTYGNKTIPVAGKGEVQVLLDGTAGEISVTSALACEGKMVEKLAVTEPGFKFYPNPVVSDMNISFGGAAFGDTMNVKIYSMGSQLVLDKDYSLNGSPVKINVSHLSQGAYLVVAKVGNQVKTVKIIKK